MEKTTLQIILGKFRRMNEKKNIQLRGNRHPDELFSFCTAGYAARLMDSTNMLLYKEFLVAFHIFLGAILLHNACGDS